MEYNTNYYSSSISKDPVTSRHNFLGLYNNQLYLKNPNKSYTTTFLNLIFGPTLHRKNEKKPIKISKTLTTQVINVKTDNYQDSTRSKQFSVNESLSSSNRGVKNIPNNIPTVNKLNLGSPTTKFNLSSSNNNMNTSLKLTSGDQIGKENMNLKWKIDKVHQPSLMDKLKPIQFSSRNSAMIPTKKDNYI